MDRCRHQLAREQATVWNGWHGLYRDMYMIRKYRDHVDSDWLPLDDKYLVR